MRTDMHTREQQAVTIQAAPPPPGLHTQCTEGTYDRVMSVRAVCVRRRLATFSKPRMPIMVFNRFQLVRVVFTANAWMHASMPKGPIWQSRMSKVCGAHAHIHIHIHTYTIPHAHIRT